MRRFGFGGIELAWVGPFLLLAGDAKRLAPYRDRVASLVIDDIAKVAREITDGGGELMLIEGPMPAPNGARLIARHPDGAVFDYLQIDSAPERH